MGNYQKNTQPLSINRILLLKKKMKIVLRILSLLFILSSCSKEEKEEIDSFNPRKLLRIDYKLGDKPIDNWTESYLYDENNKIIQVQENAVSGRKYQMIYFNERLQEYSTQRMEDNQLLFRDSIAYHPNGTISAIYNFSINLGNNLPLGAIYQFEYNNENKIIQKKTFLVDQNEYFRIEKYSWTGPNISKIAHFDGDGNIRYEMNFSYDNKVNYQRELPQLITEPLTWSAHNVTRSELKDYTGLLDPICNPCKTAYEYNQDGYPVFIKNAWGRELRLNYE